MQRPPLSLTHLDQVDALSAEVGGESRPAAAVPEGLPVGEGVAPVGHLAQLRPLVGGGGAQQAEYSVQLVDLELAGEERPPVAHLCTQMTQLLVGTDMNSPTMMQATLQMSMLQS